MDSLPTEILFEIFEYLSSADLRLRIPFVNKRFKFIIIIGALKSDTGIIPQRLYFDILPLPPPGSSLDEQTNHLTISIHSGTAMHDNSSAENKFRAEQAGLTLHPAFKKFARDCFPTVNMILFINGDRLIDRPLVYFANAISPATGTSATVIMRDTGYLELSNDRGHGVYVRDAIRVGKVMEAFVWCCRAEWGVYKGGLEGIWKGDKDIDDVKNREGWMRKHGMVRNTYRRFYKWTGDVWVEMTEEGEVGIFINLSR